MMYAAQTAALNLEEKIKELKEYKRMKEDLDAMIESLQDEIKAVMGDEDTLVAGPYKVIWKVVTQNRLDSTALKKAMPEIAAQFTKTVETRPFKVA